MTLTPIVDRLGPLLGTLVSMLGELALIAVPWTFLTVGQLLMIIVHQV
jgi:hypothetical protein